MSTIAVTGATGFIGANVVLHLVGEGHRVIACDLDPPPEPLRRAAADLGGDARWMTLDVTAEDGWAALGTEPVEHIIHGAAVTPGTPDDAPARTARVNLWGAIAALEYARRRRCRRFVFLSSSGVYGAVQSSRPLRETRAVNPTSSYALSKLCAEKFVSFYRRAHGLDACSVRLAAIYGPWERLTGARPRISPVFHLARAALRGEEIRIRGATVSRDWTSAEDVSAGLAHLVTLRDLPFDLFNLSAGRPVTLGQIADALGRLVPGAAFRTVRTGRADVAMAPGDYRAPLDVSRLRLTGFTQSTGLEEGLRRYVEWMRGAGASTSTP